MAALSFVAMMEDAFLHIGSAIRIETAKGAKTSRRNASCGTTVKRGNFVAN